MARPSGPTAWFDGETGPTVRPYAVTAGRTTPVRGAFDLISIVLAARVDMPHGVELAPEAHDILRACQEPVSVAEISAYLDLPAGTVKVLLGDLLALHLIHTRAPSPPIGLPDEPVLQAVMHGLRALR
jgi:Protein of unknown function (DUF742)